MASAQDVNPEAGLHRVTDDPLELAAATRAAERSLLRAPYYAARFGDRAVRFAHSDSGWLALVARQDLARATAQIQWLGRVLSSRGMPRRLLEVHLADLADELTRAVPARADAWLTLLAAAAALADARRRWIDDARLEALARAFDRDADPAWVERLPRTGELLASAVADERDGIPLARASVEPWFTDPARFPRRWIEAVEATLAQAAR